MFDWPEYFFLSHRWLSFVLFIPFFLVLFALGRARRGALHRAMIRNELIALALTYAVFIATWMSLNGLAHRGWLMQRREFPMPLAFPASSLVALLLILAGLSGLGQALARLLIKRPMPASYRLSRLVNLLVLGGLVLSAPIYEWLWPVLLGLAYLWLLLPPPDGPFRTIARLGLFLLSALMIGHLSLNLSGLTWPRALLTLGLAAVGWRLIYIRNRD